MKIRIDFYQDTGRMNIFVEDGNYDDAKAAIVELLGDIIKGGIKLADVGEIEKHRHAELETEAHTEVRVEKHEH